MGDFGTELIIRTVLLTAGLGWEQPFVAGLATGSIRPIAVGRSADRLIRYKATVNAAGLWVETILYAPNQAQAYALFKAIFGSGNVPHQPLQIG